MLKLKASMHEEIFWQTRISAAFRTAFGCFLAGLVLQLGNMHVQWATFPIFAYVMAVTVVGESTFGKALQDTAGVLIGTIQGLGMGMLILQLVSPERITLTVAIFCISLSSFVIVYPQRTHIIAKRIALAHSAILYVTASIKKREMDRVYFPLQLAGTTMVGAISGMLALLLPFPHLAMFQVQSQIKLSTRIISERLRIMVDAFCVNDVVKGLSLSIQARSLAQIGLTVDAEIVSKESDLGWELPAFSEHLKHLMKSLKRLKEDLVGMESAMAVDLNLSSKRVLHAMLKDCLIHLTDWACLALRHACESGRTPSCHMQLIIDEGREALTSFSEKVTVARQQLAYLSCCEFGDCLDCFLMARKLDCWTEQLVESKKGFKLPSETLFFLFCLEKFIEETNQMLLNTRGMRFEHSEKGEKSNYAHNRAAIHSLLPIAPHDHWKLQLNIETMTPCKFCHSLNHLHPQREESRWWSQRVKGWVESYVSTAQLQTAFKMSLAMAMGAFLGSWFSRRKGYWADITLGLGFTGPAKGGSFKVATLRAQGTVAGSIYGLLVVLATENLPFLRLVALIPWVILTSFLRQSKLFGYAGAVSAFTGAIVILARTNKDSSDEAFTVVRIVEAFIGMASFIIVEMLVMPRRAASIVKVELISGLHNLQGHIAAVVSIFSEDHCEKCRKAAMLDLKAKEKSLRSMFTRLQKLVVEATEEPQFWFSAFPAGVFSKLVNTQTRMMDLLQSSVSAFETVVEVCSSTDMRVHAVHNAFGSAARVLEERILPLLEFLEQALQVNGTRVLPVSKDEAMPGNSHNDIEIRTADAVTVNTCSLLKLGSARRKLLMEEFDRTYHGSASKLLFLPSDASIEKHMEDCRNFLLLSLGALAFSLDGLLQEATELEKGVHELLQLESPWSLICLWSSLKGL